MGTGIGVMTFYHFVEEDIEDQLPFSPFTRDVLTLRSRDLDGNEIVTRTRLFDPIYSRKRNLHNLAVHLKKRGNWRECQIGNLRLILLESRAVLAVCRDLAKHGIYCYDA